jgi:hypothetical protein
VVWLDVYPPILNFWFGRRRAGEGVFAGTRLVDEVGAVWQTTDLWTTSEGRARRFHVEITNDEADSPALETTLPEKDEESLARFGAIWRSGKRLSFDADVCAARHDDAEGGCDEPFG